MFKLILLVIIIIFIVVPLYRGDGMSNVVSNISGTIETIRTGTPVWVKELVVKVFSISFRLVKAVFNTVVDFIFEEAKKGMVEKLDQKKQDIKSDIIENLRGTIQAQ